MSILDLNLYNVEELVFYNSQIQAKLPEFRYLFDQWKLAQMSSALRSLGKRSVIDFLNGLDAEHIKILGDYFGSLVTIDKVNHHIVKDCTLKIGEVNKIEEGYPNFSMYRDKDQIYICFWR